MPDDAQEGEDHGEDDSLLHSDQDYDDGGEEGEEIFAGTFAADAGHTAQIDEFDGDDKDDGAEDTTRQKLERPCEEQEHESDDDGGRDLR
jgi:hypothetical protein